MPAKEVFQLCKEVLGDCHHETLTSMSNLASIYQELGQLKEAEMLQKETLKLRKEVLGEYHPQTLISMSNLALNISEAWTVGESSNATGRDTQASQGSAWGVSS